MPHLNLILIFLLIIMIIGSAYIIKVSAFNRKSMYENYPFYLSTKDNTTNIRSGPSLDYPIVWKYTRKNIPLKVIDKNNGWYQIQLPNNLQSGWISQNLTSKKKTALIVHNDVKMFISPNMNAKIVAILQNNNIVEVLKCSGKLIFCKVSISTSNKDISGWVLKLDMWGNIK